MKSACILRILFENNLRLLLADPRAPVIRLTVHLALLQVESRPESFTCIKSLFLLRKSYKASAWFFQLHEFLSSDPELVEPQYKNKIRLHAHMQF